MGDVTFTAQTRFENNMRLALNQTKPKLAIHSADRDCAGSDKIKIDNVIQNKKTSKKTERETDVQYDQTGWDGIWVAKPDADYLAKLIDNDDKLMTEVDLEGGEVMAQSAAINRAWDDAWLGGFFSSMITGKQGTVLNPFPIGNVVPVDLRVTGTGPTGMNTKKLKRAKRILTQNFVDIENVEIFIALTAQAIEDLEGEIEITNADYKSLGARLAPDGKTILGMLGFTFVTIELGNPLFDNSALTVTTDGNNYRKLPFWSKDGMVMCPWERLFTSVDPMPGKHHAHQVYSRTTVTASRTDQNRCGYVLVAE